MQYVEVGTSGEKNVWGRDQKSVGMVFVIRTLAKVVFI